MLQAGGLAMRGSICPLMSSAPDLDSGPFKIIITIRHLKLPRQPSSKHLHVPCMQVEILKTVKGEMHVGGSAPDTPTQASGGGGPLRLPITKSSL